MAIMWSRIITTFIPVVLHEHEEEKQAKHHEDNIKFQRDFVNDVEKLYDAFSNNHLKCMIYL